MNYQYLDSPIGRLRLVSDGSNLCAIEFEGQHSPTTSEREASDPILRTTSRQLREYFSGRRRRFELPLSPVGTEFQRAVWQQLERIPYGDLHTYAQIAEAIGRPKAVRAVGAANGRNPLPIVVPCHRVIGSDGSLTGFAGGLTTKRRLLELEGALTDGGPD